MSSKKFAPVQDNEHVHPVMDGYLMKCCDCGLVHEMDFRALRVKKTLPDGDWTYEALDPKKYRVLLRARRASKKK